MNTLYMLSTFDSIILGFVQGMTEFLPISSSGHLILTREILNISQSGSLAFDAVLQFATACAVILFFRKDICDLIMNLFRKEKDAQKTKLTIFLAVGTIPAIVLGLLLQEYMETVFRSTSLVALTLVLGAIVMFFADRILQKRIKNNSQSKNSLIKSIGIGFFQCLALVPGMSRSGMTISGGYILGLKKDDAIRFSFLLSIPIIFGSGAIKMLDIIRDPSVINGEVDVLVWGALSSFVFGLLAIGFLIKFLKTNSFKVFVIYRVLLAVLLLVFFI